MQTLPQANKGKNIEISTSNGTYARFPVRTPVIKSGDKLEDIIQSLVQDILLPTDTLFLSEKIVAISQGRAFKISDIHPSPLAKLLVKFVHKSKYGIGLGSPWTMELALREVGAPRILLASVAAAITKPFGIRGLFYRIAGNNINAIDGPCDYTIPPYNNYAKLGPKNPDGTAQKLSQALKVPVVIIDANDLGVNVLGRSDMSISTTWCQEAFKDNPLGQTTEQTPVALVRKI